MKPTYKHRKSRARRGQAIVETALVLAAVLIPMTLGILQFGIVINATNTLTQIAREGGRYAAISATVADPGAANPPTYNNSNTAIRTYIGQAAASTSIRAADLTTTISMVNNAARSSGNAIKVSVSYPMSRKVFLGNFFNLGRNYTAESTFILE